MSYFATIGRVIGNLKGFYSGINGATLTGAIDVIVVEQPDGTFKCSPFHVRFGKLGVLRSKEKVVDIEINGEVVPLRMKLGDSGEAFFVQEIEDEDDEFDENLATSPLPGSPRLSEGSKKGDSDESEGEGGGDEKSLGGGDVAITIVEDDGLPDKKGRKRRKKRKKNHGSKGDIKVAEILPQGGDGEGIFKMDEDFSQVAKAVKELGIHQERKGSISMSRSFHRDFYSDTEVEPNTPHTTRPSTPIQSDSEYECSKCKLGEDDEIGKWVWGELPSTVASTPVTTPTSGQVARIGGKSTKGEDPVSSDDEGSTTGKTGKSGMFSMFNFMKRQNAQSAVDNGKGIYLDDLNLESMDPETAALYFPSIMKEIRDLPKPEHDDDGESGKGSSLPQSPVPGSSPKQSHMMEHCRHRRRQESSSSTSPSTAGEPAFEAISLCGGNLSLFEQSRITFDELVENPDILLNASPEAIVVKLNGKLIPWTAAMPQLLSTTFFQRPLPSHVFQRLVDQSIKKEEGSEILLSSTPPLHTSSPAAPGGSDSGKKSYGSWFPWRRSQNSPGNNPEDPVSSPESKLLDASPENVVVKARKDLTSSLDAASALAVSATSSSDESEGTGGDKPAPIPTTATPASDKFKKSLRLSTQELIQLGLRYGQNEATFSVTTAYQGTSVARCHIYLWKWDDRVVVSDIDGTITKSDVLGHILPIIGNDWAQSGVAQLFTQIQDNGYKMLYLSARAIGQAAITREYLRSIKQGDVTLPDGPLLLNPTSLMSALHREVIEKKPEEFKIACLKDIQTLFPENPFYAGYGNKINDVWSYRAVDINISRIFTINHKGELRHALTNTFQSSYSSLVELAEHIFPAYKSLDCASQADGFTTFEFWRIPIPQLTPKEGSPEKDSKNRMRQRSYTIA